MISPSLSRQSGVFSILTAVTLLLALSCLVLVLDAGRLYMEQRKLQKIADTAALESITRLAEGRCSAAPAQAEGFAQDNIASYDLAEVRLHEFTCANLNALNGIRVPAPTETGHAVQVSVTETVPASLILRTGHLLGLDIGDTVRLQARAVAEREAVMAAFSIGAQLLNVTEDGLLAVAARKAGLDITRFTVLDSDGLLNATITSAGLLKQLGVELPVNELKVLPPDGLRAEIESDVTVGTILSASVAQLSDSLSDSEVQELTTLKNEVEVGDINGPITLFGTEHLPGLLRLTSNEPAGAALTTAISLADLLKATMLIGSLGYIDAQGREPIILEPGIGLIQEPIIPERADIDPLLEPIILENDIIGQVNIALGIIEPPSIAIGPVGTTAYNAQVRLYIDIQVELLGGLLGAQAHLPVSIDITTARAEFTAARCTAIPPAADFEINSTLLNACVGEIPDDLKWSRSARCEDNLSDTELIPGVFGHTHIEGLSQQETLRVEVDRSRQTAPNPLQFGDAIDPVVNELLHWLEFGLDPDLPPGYIEQLTPVLNKVGKRLSDTLTKLGVEPGVSTLELHELNCAAPRLSG